MRRAEDSIPVSAAQGCVLSPTRREVVLRHRFARYRAMRREKRGAWHEQGTPRLPASVRYEWDLRDALAKLLLSGARRKADTQDRYSRGLSRRELPATTTPFPSKVGAAG